MDAGDGFPEVVGVQFAGGEVVSGVVGGDGDGSAAEVGVSAKCLSGNFAMSSMLSMQRRSRVSVVYFMVLFW